MNTSLQNTSVKYSAPTARICNPTARICNPDRADLHSVLTKDNKPNYECILTSF